MSFDCTIKASFKKAYKLCSIIAMQRHYPDHTIASNAGGMSWRNAMVLVWENPRHTNTNANAFVIKFAQEITPLLCLAKCGDHFNPSRYQCCIVGHVVSAVSDLMDPVYVKTGPTLAVWSGNGFVWSCNEPCYSVPFVLCLEGQHNPS